MKEGTIEKHLKRMTVLVVVISLVILGAGGVVTLPVFRRSTRKFPAFLFFSFFVSSSVPRFFLYLQQIFNALSGLFLLEKFF